MSKIQSKLCSEQTLVVVNVSVLVVLSTLVTYLVDSTPVFESTNDGICVGFRTESVKNIVVAPDDTLLITVLGECDVGTTLAEVNKGVVL